MKEIIKSCRFLLNNYPEAQACREYIDSRISKESQEFFEFGYFPDMQNFSALTSLVGENCLKDNKLFYIKEIEDALGPRTLPISYFEEYPLVMPFKDAYGNPIAMVGRTLLSEDERKQKGLAKYKNTIFQKGNNVFGLYENKEYILQQNIVYIVEGQIDVIKATEIGFRNIIALGNSYMTAYQFSVILRYTTNINLLLDNDDAGMRGRESIINKFGNFANIQNFYIPSAYKDIDEYISKEKMSSFEDMSFLC